MNIIEILYTILDINLISKGMIGNAVNIGVEIGKYIPFILVIGIVVGFIIYRRKNHLYWGLYRIRGELYYSILKPTTRARFFKDTNNRIYTTGEWLYGRSHCFDCAFLEYTDEKLTCLYLKDHSKCPLCGKGYFIEVGSGL